MLPSLPGIRKGLNILARPYFLAALIRHRVAAASEHLDAIRHCAGNTLIDAGANKGQFSLAFRRLRPDARIIAFEPLPEAADTFTTVFTDDNLTELLPYALAGSDGSARFHVADRSDSSSLLKPGERQALAFGVHQASIIDVPLKRLDHCLDLSSLEHPIVLKVDVQGGELGVFEGCGPLEDIDFIYVELSFVELYDGQPLFEEVHDYLVGRGFAIAGVFNQVSTPQFGPTQVDVLFESKR
ncbi:MAG: methyltransferase FkbM family [Rhodococcus erythropolis]|jgi:FkbM family methyltransferase|nr:FkbM family methyltransferase [Rhodococcus erythropolis]MDF2898329.1 methyltransferase FkbM family [Rhodococcus erythropolis]